MRLAAPLDSQSRRTEKIRVSGIVQGVGFRPAVFRLATERGLCGSVGNDARGVCILVAGDGERIDDFVRALLQQAPSLSRIDGIERVVCRDEPAPGFRIIGSSRGTARAGVTPDAATCAPCAAEIFDSSRRRHRYAFTNCANCGPRFSILREVPYDRRNTSMAGFEMCPACRREYDDPGDRRFHAQPIACPECGPRMWLECLGGRRLAEGAAIEQARALLRAGEIVAVKGLGGFHLACDATDEKAIARLRARKHRDAKPFALMARDMAMIERYCVVSAAERTLIRSAAAPILLLDAGGAERLAVSVAPAQRQHAFMLPYTPLHLLLMDGLDAPIVLTSGNLSDEPQCTDNAVARERLRDIADAFLMHDREIINRVDDSVLRVSAGEARVIRRARGYAPASLPLPAGFGAVPAVLAFGGDLKNTFCLLREGEAIVSQHIGDLEHASAFDDYRNGLARHLRLFDHAPTALAVDLHPEYRASKLGREWAALHDLPLVEVQHHHAHIAACMAENRVAAGDPPVLGVALDGLGYGGDGTFWGGEFLMAGYRECRRLGSFKPAPMPGGVQAIRQPWRMAYAWLRQDPDWTRLHREFGTLPFFRALAGKPVAALDAMIDSGINSPLTSSCGRLFDAVAAIIGLRLEVSYEGQAAMELEAAMGTPAHTRDDGYPFTVGQMPGESMAWIDPGPLWPALLADVAEGCAPASISARFHRGLADAVVAMVAHLSEHHGDPWQGRVALSGGVFQNDFLLNQVTKSLQDASLKVYTHSKIPTNDGGLAVGQAMVAGAIMSLQS